MTFLIERNARTLGPPAEQEPLANFTSNQVSLEERLVLHLVTSGAG